MGLPQVRGGGGLQGLEKLEGILIIQEILIILSQEN